ncbi:hypothetical protein EBU95_20455, partial [bacterium]|nr:hypothetical protein [bacterium]
MPICPLCSKEFKQLHGSHINKHGITTEEFKKQFPDVWLGNSSSYEVGQRNKQQRLLAEKPIHCIHCGDRITDIYRKQKRFCNSSCSASYTNTRRTLNKDKKVITRNCLHCNTEFTRYCSKTERGKYCSIACQCRDKSVKALELSSKLLLEGKLTDLSRNRIKKTMRHLGIKDKCSICGIVDWQGKPLPFILD